MDRLQCFPIFLLAGHVETNVCSTASQLSAALQTHTVLLQHPWLRIYLCICCIYWTETGHAWSPTNIWSIKIWKNMMNWVQRITSVSTDKGNKKQLFHFSIRHQTFVLQDSFWENVSIQWLFSILMDQLQIIKKRLDKQCRENNNE